MSVRMLFPSGLNKKTVKVTGLVFFRTFGIVPQNIIGGFILLHFNCDSEVPAVGTGYTLKV